MTIVRFACRTLLASVTLASSLAALSLSPVAAVEVVCHRGANEYAPENTYASSQLCIDWGVDYIEIDVRSSKDGVLYLLHDPTVNRTTNGSGFLRGLASEQVDQLDAGGWFDPKFANQRVPRLDEYLRWVKGKAKIYFDVKDADLQQLIDLVYEVGLQHDCFFWFSSSKKAAEFRQLDAKLPLKINVSTPDDVRKAHQELGATIVELGLKNMNDEMLATCRELGVRAMILEMNKDEDKFRRVIESGADMVNLDHGDLFLKVQSELQAATQHEQQ